MLGGCRPDAYYKYIGRCLWCPLSSLRSIPSGRHAAALEIGTETPLVSSKNAALRQSTTLRSRLATCLSYADGLHTCREVYKLRACVRLQLLHQAWRPLSALRRALSTKYCIVLYCISIVLYCIVVHSTGGAARENVVGDAGDRNELSVCLSESDPVPKSMFFYC